jgi:Domain of unknown function (DUF6438)
MVTLRIFGTTVLLLISPLVHAARSGGQILEPIIVLERESDVFQVAPEYRLSIFDDGVVLFQGKKHVKSQEPIRTKIDKEQLAKLLTAFERINFYSLRDRYEGDNDGCGMKGTDQPYATITLNMGGKKKRIVHYFGCWEENAPHVVYPQMLFKLEAMIDEVVNSKQWLE